MSKRRRSRAPERRWRRWLRYIYLRFVRLRATPNEISLGFAFGVFWGMFPLPGLQMLTAIMTAALFRSNKLAAAAGTWLTNPVTTLPFIALHLHVGQTVRGREWNDFLLEQVQSLNPLEWGADALISYLLGCLINGMAFAIACYLIGLPLVAYAQYQIARQRDRQHRP